MNSTSIIAETAATLALFGLGACAFTARKTAPLPSACTLPGLSPKERDAQLARCSKISNAASAIRQTETGFHFEVDLGVMPLTEVQEWAEHEQGCCSFLEIAVAKEQRGKVATVAIKYPEENRREVMTGFRLL